MDLALIYLKRIIYFILFILNIPLDQGKSINSNFENNIIERDNHKLQN